VYVPNGREVGHPHYGYKLDWLAALRETVRDELSGGRPFVVLGDFNIAPDDSDVWDIAAFAGSTHVTEPERQALAALRDAGLSDIYPRPLKYDIPFTYWDYRALAFPNNKGMRIDLAYGDAPFVAGVTDAFVDRDQRKGKGSSDHAPLILDTALGS
jgi:exodeoxyribonuclease-3